MSQKNDKSIKKSGLHEICGIVFLALCIIAFFAVFSYDPNDIGALKCPPNSPAVNFIGPVGALFLFVFSSFLAFLLICFLRFFNCRFDRIIEIGAEILAAFGVVYYDAFFFEHFA